MEAPDHIKQIEEKLIGLINSARLLRKENEKLRADLEEKSKDNRSLQSTVEGLQLQVDLLKTSLPEDAKVARSAVEKKINDYIREIDRCIALLGEGA